MNFLPNNSKVKELINRDSGDWNRSLIYQVFKPEEIKKIITIPISKIGAANKLLIWRSSKDNNLLLDLLIT